MQTTPFGTLDSPAQAATATVAAGHVLVVFLVGFKGFGVEQRFWIFAGLMAAAGVLFGLRAAFYVPRDYTQG